MLGWCSHYLPIRCPTNSWWASCLLSRPPRWLRGWCWSCSYWRLLICMRTSLLRQLIRLRAGLRSCLRGSCRLKRRCSLRRCRDLFFPCRCFRLGRRGIDLRLWCRFLGCIRRHLLGGLLYILGFRNRLSSRSVATQRSLGVLHKLACGDLRRLRWLKRPSMIRTVLDFWLGSQLREYSNRRLQGADNLPRPSWFGGLRGLGGSSMSRQILLGWEQRIGWDPLGRYFLCWHCESLCWQDFGGIFFACRHFRTQRGKRWHAWLSRARIMKVWRFLWRRR